MKKLYTSKKSLIIVVAFLVLGAIVLIAGKNSADKQAQAYQEQVNNLSSEVDALKQQTDSITFAEKIVVGRAETEAELNGIEAECEKLSGVAQDAKAIGATSELSGHPFAFLSSSYRSTKSPIDLTVVASLESESTKLAKICNQYIKDVETFSKYDKFSAEREALTQPASESCDSASGCLPPEDELEYKKYYEEVVLGTKAGIDNLDRGCDFEELKELCDILLAYYKRDLTLQETYYNALGSGDVDDEALAFEANPYPDAELCDAAGKVTGNGGITENCFTEAYKFVAAKYQQQIKAEVAKL